MVFDLKPYPAYKASRVEWLREVPEHWEARRIKTIADVINGATPSSSVPAYWGGDITWITPEDLGALDDCHITTSARTITTEGYKSCSTSLAPAGSLAISTRAPIGHVGILQYPACVNQGCRLLIPKKSIRSDYFYYNLKLAKPQLQSFGQGSTFAELSCVKLEQFVLPLPPLSEQIAITRYLDYIGCNINHYIQAKQKLITLLEKQKQATIQEAVTGRIDVSIGQPYLTYKNSGAEWLGEVPEHWNVERLKSSVANIVDQKTEWQRSGICLALEHVESWTGKLIDSNYVAPPDCQLKCFQPEDILFGKLRPYLGKVVRPKFGGRCVGEFLVLRSRGELFRSCYLEYLLRSKPVINIINSSTFGAKMPRADWNFIGCLKVVRPPLSEQTAIARYLDEASSNIDAVIAWAQSEIELFHEYRERLISDIVTGKLDVREAVAELPIWKERQDADESAEFI